MTAIIVHGGAGTFEPEARDTARQGCLRAVEAGQTSLNEGAGALEVVEQAVRILEDDPTFNAGTGSFPNADGETEMDAILVDGATLNFGSVAAIQGVKNPIRVARAVMERTNHCMLVGFGASRFAQKQGFEPGSPGALPPSAGGRSDHGTVGAVVLDREGHIAAGTSTGGTRGKVPGRAGDSPLIGCGALAVDGVGGASATGDGEALMRVMMARTALDFIQQGMDAQTAAERAVDVLRDRVDGRGGVICVDARGGIGSAFNTSHMATARAYDGSAATSSI